MSRLTNSLRQSSSILESLVFNIPVGNAICLVGKLLNQYITSCFNSGKCPFINLFMRCSQIKARQQRAIESNSRLTNSLRLVKSENEYFNHQMIRSFYSIIKIISQLFKKQNFISTLNSSGGCCGQRNMGQSEKS